MYDAIDDPYTYENSTVLINKLNLRDQAALDAFKAEISSARSEEPLPEGELDFLHYRAIHHHLFQDVYDWAGEVRAVRLAKGGNPFCFPEHIEAQATMLFADLKTANFFRDLTPDDFAAKCAHFLSELNAVPLRPARCRVPEQSRHPAREMAAGAIRDAHDGCWELASQPWA